MVNMNKVNEFINGENYEFLLRSIQEKSNIEIDSTIPFVLLDYDKEMLIAARIEIEDLESLLNSYMTEIVSFVEGKMKYDFEDEDEYPEGEELIDEEKPKTITELPYYKNFLIVYLIEYYLLKKQPAELGKYLKRIHIPHAATYERELKDIWRETLES